MNQQQLPLNFDQTLPEGFTNLVIYRSSAGSGKTFTLVKDYIKLLLRDTENYRRILAITFTNKATEEMKNRILGELSQMALDKETDVRSKIEEEFEEEFSKVGSHVPPIAKRAREAVEKILHNYGRFGVSTLDHFFTRVVRSMARELNLPLKYDIDVDNDRAIDFAVEETYKMLGEDDTLRSWLEEFAYSKIEDNKAWNPDAELKNLGKELFNERFHQGIGKYQVPLEEFKRFMEVLSNRRDTFSSKMKKLGERGLKIIADHDLEVEDFTRRGAGNAGDFRKLVRGEFSLGKTFIKIANGEADWYTKTSPNKDQIELAAENGLDMVAQETYQYYLAEYGGYMSAVMLLKNIFAYGILDFLEKKLKDYRTENNLVLLADNAFLMNEFIRDQDAPFVYEKLGTRYSHILIDEFQDTSLYQWNNLLPLIRNSLYENGQVLIVGDEKQSIYRWRGGEMRLLVSGIEEDLAHFKNQTKVENLKDNYRSAKTIVGFNNSFFKTAAELLRQNENLPEGETLIADTYLNVNQQNTKDTQGYIEVQFFSNDSEGGEELSWKDKAKNETVKLIRNARKQGFNFGDILILIDRWVMGDEIAQYLVKNDLPIISDRTLQVQSSPRVKLLLSALKWLHNTDDKLAKTNLLFLYIDFKEIMEHSYDSIFTDIHTDSPLFNEIIPEEFLKNLKVFLRLPLYELVESLIIVFGLEGKTDNFVLRFMEICLEQSAWGRNDLHSFLNWWDKLSEDQTVIMPETDDAIWIMTVHKAKGLERPIVIMPFANFDLRTKGYSTFWTDKLSEQYDPFKLLPLNFSSKLLETDFSEAYKYELQDGMVERLNNIYVAFTRAETRLYIFLDYHKKLSEPSNIGSLSSLMKAVLVQGPMLPDETQGAVAHGRGEEAEEIHTWGKESEKEEEKRESSEKVEELSDIISSPINDKIRIRSESNRFFMLFDNEKSRVLRRGTILHRVFELMDSSHDLDKIINQLLAEGLIQDKQVQEIKDIASSFMGRKEFKDWFDGTWEVLSERDIISEGAINRPDKVLIKPNQTVLIDFKTGNKESKHINQIKMYAGLLDIMGYKNVKKFLVYLDQEEIVDVE